MGTRKVTTPIFRASYLVTDEPKQSESGSWYWGVSMIFEPDVVEDPDFLEMKAIVQEAIQGKWKGSPPKTGIRSPFRRGEWKSQAYPQGFDLDKYPEYEGKIVVAAYAYTKQLADGRFDTSKKPGVVGPNAKRIVDFENEPVYSGMYARAIISAYVPKKGEPGVSMGLHHIQKVYDGEALGGTNGNPEEAFEAFQQPISEGYHDDLLGV